MNFNSSKNSIKKYKFFIFIFFIIITSISQIKAQPLTTECEQFIDSTYCSNWGSWQTASIWLDIPINGNHCPLQVFYKHRVCQSNILIHQYQILSYVMNFGYKVWIPSYGWLHPCRGALDLFKGSSNDVSLRNNELLDNIFKKLAVDLFNINTSQGMYCPICNNQNINLVKFIAKHGACGGACRVQRPSLIFGLDSLNFEITTPPLDLILDTYLPLPIPYVGSDSLHLVIDSISVVPLDSIDLLDLNLYIQTEINNFIVDSEYQLHEIAMVKDAILVMTPIDCISDYCCIYEISFCIDNNGNTQITETRTASVPDCPEYPPLSACPEGEYKVLYPCKATCGE